MAKGYTTETPVEAEIGNSLSGSTVPTSTQLVDWIEEVEEQIDERTGCSFSSTTVTNAILPFDEHTSFKSSQVNAGYSLRADGDRLYAVDSVFLLDESGKKVKPIISVSSLSVNQNGSNIDADSWTSITQNSGSGGSFFLDKITGMVTFHQDKPSFGLQRAIKWSGNYGFSSIPKKVQMLATKLVAKRILQMKSKASQFSSIDSITLESISISKNIQNTVTYLGYVDKETEDLFKEITGDFSSDISK